MRMFARRDGRVIDWKSPSDDEKEIESDLDVGDEFDADPAGLTLIAMGYLLL